MLGIVYSIVAGICMSLQGVFNTRLSEKIGLWETNTIVQITGFILTFIIFLFAGKGGFKNIFHVNKLYLLGGVLGAVIVFTVMRGISQLGTTCSIATILVAQLTSAALIDAFGLFGASVIKFDGLKIIGVCVMIAGIIIFKCKG